MPLLYLQSVAVQSGRFLVLRCRDASLADWPRNPHKIVSATVNLNSIDLSRHFADAISALKCG
jgi:hypothetical protein